MCLVNSFIEIIAVCFVPLVVGFRPSPDFDALRREILSLHQKTSDAHWKKNVEFFVKDISEDYFSVGNGEMRNLGREEITSQFERYLHSTMFTEYRDVREPIVGFSKDGSMAWSVARTIPVSRRAFTS
jgi:hypothetical protein